LAGIGGIRLAAHFIDLVPQGTNLFFDRGRVLSLCLELADGLGNGLALALQALSFGLGLATLGVTGQHLIDRKVRIPAPGGEPVSDAIGFVPE
jgi:hypothetical protein